MPRGRALGAAVLADVVAVNCCNDGRRYIAHGPRAGTNWFLARSADFRFDTELNGTVQSVPKPHLPPSQTRPRCPPGLLWRRPGRQQVGLKGLSRSAPWHLLLSLLEGHRTLDPIRAARAVHTHMCGRRAGGHRGRPHCRRPTVGNLRELRWGACLRKSPAQDGYTALRSTTAVYPMATLSKPQSYA